MESGAHLSITKSSFFSGRRELFNEHGGKVGAFRLRGWIGERAEGEAAGKTLTFSHNGWNTRRSKVTDEWGHELGTMHRNSWWGTSAQLILFEKEYVWRTNAWGSKFWIEHTDGTKVVEVVGCGGFGMQGKAEFFQTVHTEEALPLIYMGLYQMRLFETEVGASTAVVASLIAVFA